jgi:hypothetical protein
MTHRTFSRNAASSRAIPVEKMLSGIEMNPAMPTYWGRNQKGMSAAEELTDREREEAEAVWLEARDYAVKQARHLASLGVHKQIANRLVEPFCFITTIITATEWTNFFWLRCHRAAQPEMRELARCICEAYHTSEPNWVGDGHWHRPYVTEEDNRLLSDCPEWSQQLNLICAGRCARVSYLTHDGKRDNSEDIRLAKQLAQEPHASPFEHVATPAADPNSWSGNFKGWTQFRKLYLGNAENHTEPLGSVDAYMNRE